MPEMIATAGLFEQYRKKLLGPPWYHQRFDGCPLFIGYIGEAQARTEERKRDNQFELQLGFYENGRTDWYMDQADIDRVTQNFVKLCNKHHAIGHQVLADWRNDELAFFDQCIELRNTDLARLDDRQLKIVFEEFSENYLRRLTSSSLIDGFALGSDELVAQQVRDKLAAHNLSENFTQYFSKLTAPIHQSFINDVEAAVLEVAQAVSKKPALKQAFENQKTEQLLETLLRHPHEHEMIKQLATRFFWSKNNYIHDHVLDEQHFITEINEILREKTDIAQKIQKIRNTPIENKRTKEKLFKELGIDGELAALIHLNEDFTFWQDERKKATYWGTHYVSVLLAEIGKRKGYGVEELKYFAPCEVMHAFEEKDWKPELRERQIGCVFLWDTNHFEVLTGEKYREFRKEFQGTTDYTHLNEFKGLTANMGRVTGT
ncbi:MAG: hypothetical protein Q7R47_00800, partial [Candidatus Diapherotrites archaeon]|nr:hypothetical protein [Candidatus Diapherotrites archaeon]